MHGNRLSIHQGRVLFTTTPYYLGWLKWEIADRGAIDIGFGHDEFR